MGFNEKFVVCSSVLFLGNKVTRTEMLGFPQQPDAFLRDSTRLMLSKQEGIRWKGESLQTPQSLGGQGR